MAKRTYTAEELIQRSWDIQQIKNVMGRHAYYHEYNRHDWEMDELWVNKEENKPTTAFGQGHGFQIGYDLIDDNYNRKSFNIWREGLQEFIDENPAVEMKFENLAMGSLLIHCITTPVIEIAEDGLTAQGTFDGNGMITMAYPGDEVSTKMMFERYNCDFIKEDGEWKLWKMFIATDVLVTPAGSDVSQEKVDVNFEIEFKLRQLDEEEVDMETEIILNHPMSAYTVIFNCPEWPPVAEPYATYAGVVSNDVFSHPGYKEEK